MDRSVVDYYDRLAPTYDAVRFGNSYGKFLDLQERAILASFVPKGCSRILDVGCGTGRLMDCATYGCDPSLESVKRAARRHPTKTVVAADAILLPFAPATFDAAFCFHVLMHLGIDDIAALLAEISRILTPGGVFIADIVSGFRRGLRPRSTSGWHGETALTRRQFRILGRSAKLRLRATAGVALAPVHRIPARMRPPLVKLDRAIARIVPDLSSYLVCRFVREAAP